jgi:hypothetical protein
MNIQEDGSLLLTKEDAEALALYFKKTIFLEPIDEQTADIQKFFRTLNVIDGELAEIPFKGTHVEYLEKQVYKCKMYIELYTHLQQVENTKKRIENPVENVPGMIPTISNSKLLWPGIKSFYDYNNDLEKETISFSKGIEEIKYKALLKEIEEKEKGKSTLKNLFGLIK